jgi:hypothetical protein
MPENTWGANIILLVAALWPNNLQIFSVVSNDGLVYLLSLGLILVVLNCIRAESPSWKQGLLLGTIFALALLTKMTILLTAAALFLVLVFDSILDRHRGWAYLKMLPAVLLPVFLLAGPFIISRIIWYGDPTGEELLKILTPAWVRPSPRSFAEVLGAMAQILPGTFLADLCWQQLTFPLISVPLFVLWFFLNVLMGSRTVLLGFRRACREEMLKMLLVFSSFFFMFLALYEISVNWVGMQFRHVWNLWPMTLLAPYFAIKDLKFLRRFRRERILSIVSPGLILALILINIAVIYNYIIRCHPVQNLSRANLDYATFMNWWMQNPNTGLKYLDGTSLSDVLAYRHFAQRHDWNNALFHARRALREGANKRESHLMCVCALRALGKPEEALETLHTLEDKSYEAQLLEIHLLMDLGRFPDASDRIRQVLPLAPQDIQIQLKVMLKKARMIQSSD